MDVSHWVRLHSLSNNRPNVTVVILLVTLLSVLPSFMFNPIAVVHAQTAFDYSLSNTGGITILPGGSGSTNVTATLLAGTPSNVTLSCIDATLPLGASCSFSPESIIPNFAGNSSRLTIVTPASAPYGVSNVSVTAGPLEKPVSPTNVTLTVAAKVAVNPTGRSLLDYHGRVSYQVNITGVPPFSFFAVALHYNNRILQNPVVEYGGNVLGTDTLILSECVNGINVNPADPNNPFCTPIPGVDGPGVVSLSLLAAENSTGNPTNGKLFNVTFDAVGTGFSSIHILYQQIGTVTNSAGGIQLAAIPVDGYFTNVECGGNPCLPLTASFRPLTSAVAGRSVTFVATAASQNCCPKGNITFYQWFFGPSASIGFIKSESSNATVVFATVGEYAVTLSVVDNFGAMAYYTTTIHVVRANSLTVSEFFTDSSLKPLPSDNNGNPMMKVVLVKGIVEGTNPRLVLAWVNVTNTSGSSLNSLKLNETLPMDWSVSQAQNTIRVFIAFPNGTRQEITDQTSIAVHSGNPEMVSVSMTNITESGVNNSALAQGQSILLSVKLTYALIGASQSATSYPRFFTDYASASAWTQALYNGTPVYGTSSGFFIAYARVVGHLGHSDSMIAASKFAIV